MKMSTLRDQSAPVLYGLVVLFVLAMGGFGNIFSSTSSNKGNSENCDPERFVACSDNENISVVDGSWHLPTLNRDPKEEFDKKHIPGSVFFDIDKISDSTNSLPHMIPSETYFADQVEALGISNRNHVIAYDSTGFGSAARVWWMFRLFGHKHVSVSRAALGLS